jgi:N-glycosylase/DNA lyase
MEILNKIESLKKEPIKKVIYSRMREFEEVGKNKNKIFSELCFCILTANSSAENCIRVQKEAGEHFEGLKEEELAKLFKEVGCRFHTKRANYIVNAREKKKELLERVGFLEERELRDWVADNIKGLGMKESSHFLRNIGYKNVAIIDFHIIDLLEREGLIKRPKILKRAEYCEIEKVLEKLGSRAKLNLAELDLFLWYIETGKVLK